jgi:3-deoxy-D-manno-octulosonic-acid transferase
VLLIPLFVFKMWRRGKYRENFLQRFGRYSPEARQQLAGKNRRRAWIHAVSVGEMNVAFALIPELLRRLPDWQIVVTTTTSTGQALARQRLPANIPVLYFPLDFPPFRRRAYDHIRPDAVILVESELWPGHIWEAERRGVPVFLVNARMSPRSARRHRWAQPVFRSVFDKLAAVCAQSREDAGNFAALGAPRDRVHFTGNMKYDASLPQAGARTFDPRQALSDIGVKPDQPVLVAGSTHPGEEEILFDAVAALRAKFPDLFFVLVPRHVERTPEIVELAKRKGVRLALRTAPGACDCLLVNTTGELKWFYEVATVIFVGKSLAGIGGQNIVEAAASGHPVVFGPNMQNFQEIARQFVSEGAGIQVADAGELQRVLAELLADAGKRERVASAARRVIEANRGATARTVELIAQRLH